MNIKIDFEGFDKFRRKVGKINADRRKIMSGALNSAAFAARKNIVKAIAESFDRPVPWISKSPFVIMAKPELLVATLTLEHTYNKNIVTPGKVLKAQIKGGGRSAKRFEKLLRNAGYLPAGWVTAAGSGVTLDQYGNVPPSQIVQILSYLKAFPEQGYRANRSDRSDRSKPKKRYFVARFGGHLQPGIYQRIDREIKPILIFVRASYQRRLHFYDIVSKSTKETIASKFNQEVADVFSEKI